MGKRQEGSAWKAGGGWLVASGVLVLVGLAGTGIFAFMQSQAPKAIPVTTTEVQRGAIEVTINESGTVLLGGQQTLTSPVEGAVEQVLVQAGDRIQQGQTLIILRNPERATALADQQLQIQRQEVNLARSRQRILEAQGQLESDRQQLQRLQVLGREGAIALTEIQAQENRVRTNLAALRTAEAETELAQLELERLRLANRRIEQELQDTIIAAPLTGIVLGVSVKNGDGVERRTDLLTLGNPTAELVDLQLSTLNASQIQINQPARISVIGPDPQVFSGRVAQIYPQANPGDPNSANPQATVPVTVRLDVPTQTLIPSSQVNVEMIVAQRQNVPTLPIEFVQNQSSGQFVWMLDPDNRVRRQTVTLGLEGMTTAEIKSGLSPGDVVIMPEAEVPLTPGLPVIPQPMQE